MSAEDELESTFVVAWARLLRVSQALLAAADADLKSKGFPPLAWYDAMLELKRAGDAGLRPFELQREMLLAQYNISRLIDRLVGAGYVDRRSAVSDGRGQILTITEAGRAQLKSMALDDFGTGYSNLAYIPRYPIGCIKIDKSFVDQLPHSSAVIGLILSLGRQIGAKVVAEGVETSDQLLHLHLAKCSEYQGYLLQRPQPVDQVTRFLDQQARDFCVRNVPNQLNDKMCFG